MDPFFANKKRKTRRLKADEHASLHSEEENMEDFSEENLEDFLEENMEDFFRLKVKPL